MSKVSSPTNNNIKINPEYSKLVNPLSNAEYEVLKNSISNKGLHLPIIINHNNVILDGHNRLKICQELGIEPKFEFKKFSDQSQEKEFVIEINLKRRHLNNFQIAELAYQLEKIESERAKLRSLNNLKYVKDKLSKGPIDHFEPTAYKGKTREIVSTKVGISQGSYERAKTIIKYGSEQSKEKLRDGKSSIYKEYNKTRRDKKRQELISQMKSSESESNYRKAITYNCQLMLGDFREKGKEIEDDSIDLIFTDPPYGEEYLYLYEDLAELVVRVLKPGGSLVFYVGHIILDQVIGIFNDFSLNNNTNNSGLKYWWTLAVKHSGHHTKIHPRYVFAEWKPLLWYIKGERANNLVISNTIGDYIESTPPLKIEHKWQQSTIEAEYIIKNLTLANQTVLDPMMGSGTTGIAALKLNRKFIGIEKDEEYFTNGKNRIEHYANI